MSRLTASIKDIPRLPWGMLPPTLRLLFVTEDHQMAIWLREAFASDSACAIELDVAADPIAAIERLENRMSDVVVIAHHGVPTLQWIEAIRLSAKGQPIQVMGNSSDREFSAMCFEAGADGFLTMDTMTIREMLWHFARSTERRLLLKESEALRTLGERHLNAVHDEVVGHLAEQQRMLDAMCGEFEDHQAEWIQQQLAEISSEYLNSHGSLDQALDRFVANMEARGVNLTQVLGAMIHAVQTAVNQHGPNDSRPIADRGYVLMMRLISKMEANRNRAELQG